MPSTTTSASPGGRRTSIITPVEVSLCAQAITSASPGSRSSGALPGSAACTIGSARKGARAVASANFDENSPLTRWQERSATSPNAATSQNAVAPPIPRQTSNPAGSAEELAQARADPRHQAQDRRLAV